MPLYEYKCIKCGAEKTVIRKVSERDNELCCEKCRQHNKYFNIFTNWYMKRKPSMFGVNWKCGGGYRGDN